MKRSLLWSLVGHLILFLLLVIQSLIKHEENYAPASAIEVKSVSEADFQKALKRELEANSKEKQIVQIDPSLKSEEAPSEKAKYLSSHNQIADNETRAAKFGKFKNIFNQGNPNGGDQKKISQLLKITDSTESPPKGREPASAPTGRLRRPASEDGPKGEGESATDDYLQDVAIGAQTLLNAKEFKYYSFYARIREKLSETWQVKLREEIPLLQSQGHPISNQTRKTSIRVFLSPSGQLQKIQILEGSGLAGLDRAATDAFRQSAPFPNPPQGMIGDDGLVSIRWDFVLVADADQNVQFTIQRTGYR
ncbi:MAG: TonB family protein [Proteobacteria bacterium]|nr:TonB family protein [Pseudomonadota bacterium]